MMKRESRENKKISLVLSCEHAVDTIPEPYAPLFASFQKLLTTHRGIDFGALQIAEYLTHHIPCDFTAAPCTRLLIDSNRSLSSSQCFSEVTNKLSAEEKQKIIAEYYQPFRQQVMEQIEEHVNNGFQVFHLSVHSFTPIWDGVKRNADIGLLYDPSRPSEKVLAQLWKAKLKSVAPHYKVRMNYPYKGISDGFTSTLRKRYRDPQYIGMELECNQALTQDTTQLKTLKRILAQSLIHLLS